MYIYENSQQKIKKKYFKFDVTFVENGHLFRAKIIFIECANKTNKK